MTDIWGTFSLLLQEGMDVSVVSPLSNLTVAAYRQMKNGTVKMGKMDRFKEIPRKKIGNRI